MTASLRPVGEHDLEALAALSVETFRDTFINHVSSADMGKFLAETYAPTVLAQEWADPNVRFTVATFRQELIGYTKIVLSQQPDDGTVLDMPGEIQRIYCRKDWLGKGIGRLLLLDALLQLFRAGCHTAWLGVWEHNAKALRFYRQHGFEVFGEHSFRVGQQVDTDLLMARPL